MVYTVGHSITKVRNFIRRPFKKLIQFLECSWNHEYFRSLAKKETQSIHDSINIPKIEFITYIYILL